MAIAANEVVRVVVRGRIHGQKTINVFHFKCFAGGGNELLQALLTAVIQCIVESLLPRISSEWSFEGVTGTKLSGQFDEITDTSQSGAGAILQDALPAVIAGVIRWHTSVGGRSGRGRTYIAGIATISEDDSFWENVDVLLGDFLNCMLGKFKLVGGTDPNWKLAILSRKFLQANPGNYDGATQAVVGGSLHPNPCTMRSRQVKPS